LVWKKVGRGVGCTMIAIIGGVKGETAVRWVVEIGEVEGRGVVDVSMDF